MPSPSDWPHTTYWDNARGDMSLFDLSALQDCTIAGEAMNPMVYQTFRDLTGLELKEGYGQTEMTLAVVTNYWQPTKPGSMGTPSPGYDVVLLKEDQTEAAVGEDGEICLRLPDGAHPLGGRESVVSCEPRGWPTSHRPPRPAGAPST